QPQKPLPQPHLPSSQSYQRPLPFTSSSLTSLQDKGKQPLHAQVSNLADVSQPLSLPPQAPQLPPPPTHSPLTFFPPTSFPAPPTTANVTSQAAQSRALPSVRESPTGPRPVRMLPSIPPTPSSATNPNHPGGSILRP
ncbi:hypothetical protein FRC16_005544, partial [Serendipita sp. 398]